MLNGMVREIRVLIPKETVDFIEANITKELAPFCNKVLNEMLQNFIVQIKEQKLKASVVGNNKGEEVKNVKDK